MSEKILKGLREAVWYFDEDEVKRLSEERRGLHNRTHRLGAGDGGGGGDPKS
jgi:hypothetical protein